MKLDPRIKAGKKLLDCFDTEEAESYVGKECYFSADMFPFADMSGRANRDLIYKGILLKVWPDGSDPYETDSQRFYAYCLPCDWVTEEKKYRPFIDTKEFFLMRNREVGDLIHIRSKLNNYEYHLLIIGWTDEGLMLGNFSKMTFDELLDKFELWDAAAREWVPFGVEDKE